MTASSPPTWPTLHFPEFVLHHLPVGLLTVDADLKINYFNPAAEQITGHNQEEALGRYCGEVLKGGQCQRDCPLRTVLSRNQESVTLETHIHTKQGQVVPVRLRTAAMFDRQGQLIGALEAFSDISEVKALEEERSQTLSFFAHDMKAPLISISGFAQRLLEGKAGPLSQRQERYLRVIQDESRQIQALALDFLDVARLGDVGAGLVLAPVDLDALIQGMVPEYGAKAEDKGLELSIELAPNLPQLQGDPHRLRRALANLLDNAFNYAGQGRVELGVAIQAGPLVVITVRDQGPGLTPEDLETIFAPFQRGSAARGTEGTGLGLAAVQRIAHAHHGRLEAANHPQGGAVFTLSLPGQEALPFPDPGEPGATSKGSR